MKTFAEYMPTMTAREREIVETYENACLDFAFEDDGAKKTPLQRMRSTPPAKEQEWIEREVEQSIFGASIVRIAWPAFRPGTRVRVGKIEETT